MGGESSSREEELRAKLLRNKQRRLSNNNSDGRDGDDNGATSERRDEFGRAITTHGSRQRSHDNSRRNGTSFRRDSSKRDSYEDDDRRRNNEHYRRDGRHSNNSRNNRRDDDYDRRRDGNSSRGQRRRRSRSRRRSQSRSNGRRSGSSESTNRSMSGRRNNSRSRSRSGNDGRHRDNYNNNYYNRREHHDDRRYDDYRGSYNSRWGEHRDDRYDRNYHHDHPHHRRPPPQQQQHHHHQRREPIPPPYNVGDVVGGVISRIENYGAFVALDTPNNNGSRGGGFRGMIHISALRPSEEGRVEHPSEVVRMNQQVKVLVLEIVPPMDGGSGDDNRRGGRNFNIRLSLAAIDPNTGNVREGFVMPPPRGNPSAGSGGRAGGSYNIPRDRMLQHRAEERRRLRVNQDGGGVDLVDNKAAWQMSNDEMKSYHRGMLPPSILVWDLPSDDEMDGPPQKKRGGTKRSRSASQSASSSSSSDSSSTSSSSYTSSSSSSSSSSASSSHRRRRRKHSSRRSNRRRRNGRSSNRRRRRRDDDSDSSSTSSSSSSGSSSSDSSRSRSGSRDRKKPRRSHDEKADNSANIDEDNDDNGKIEGDKTVDDPDGSMPIEEDDLKEAQDFKKAVQGNKPSNGAESDSDDDVGPQPLAQSNTLNNKASSGGAASNAYGSALLPGEGEALAQYVQQNLRIPRRGEIGYSSTDIDGYEKSGYVMSGSRHARMNAVRIRKENQIYSAEEQRALALITLEENQQKEQALMQDFREMLQDKLKDGSGKVGSKTAGDG